MEAIQQAKGILLRLIQDIGWSSSKNKIVKSPGKKRRKISFPQSNKIKRDTCVMERNQQVNSTG